MKSMTGFGRATAMVAGRRYVVEVRSVNHRGIDVKVRGRDLDGTCELEIVKAVRAAIERGAVSINVRDEGEGGSALDGDRVRSLHRSLDNLRRELRLPDPVTLETVAAFLGTSVTGDTQAAASWEAISPALGQALEALTAMRANEGRALAVDMTTRLENMNRIVNAIERGAGALPTRAAQKLKDRLATIASDTSVDPARLAQEIALLAERLDVSEELVRLATHLKHLTTLIETRSGGAVGRKMDFVIQEVGRELNTIGAKIQDADIAGFVIEGKAELEKIREQAQNIE